jgi:hypothetical protein
MSYWLMAALTFVVLPMSMRTGSPSNAWIPEPSGAMEVFRSISYAGMKLVPGYQGGLDLGNPFQVYGSINTFVWDGIEWSTPVILGRLLWIGVALGIAFLASSLFDRFDPVNLTIHVREEEMFSRFESDSQFAQPPSVVSQSISLSKTVSHGSRIGVFLYIIENEFHLMLKGRRWWWYMVAMGLILAASFLTINESRQILLPFAFVWPLLIWSQLGNREIQNRTDQLVFSAAFPLRRQLMASWTAGFILSLIAGSGVMIRLILAGEFNYILSFIVAAAFIPALALALGVWSEGSKSFEVVYLLLWTLGPMNQMMAALGFPMVAEQLATFDYLGSSDAAINSGMPLYYAVFTILLLVAAIVGRKRQLQV